MDDMKNVALFTLTHKMCDSEIDSNHSFVLCFSLGD